MGMTIDEAIKHYEDIKKGWSLMYPYRLYDFTIATMRKYQKIEKIVQSKTTRESYDIGFRQIKKVIEDGNDD